MTPSTRAAVQAGWGPATGPDDGYSNMSFSFTEMSTVGGPTVSARALQQQLLHTQAECLQIANEIAAMRMEP
jgi:hypothetical protein